MFNRVCCGSVTLLLVGIGCLTASLVLIFLGDSFINATVKKQCQLREGTLVYKTWSDPPVPMYISFYVFDLENDADFLSGKAKPHVRQRGPFVYRERRSKTDIELFENGTISYREPRTYEFIREKSDESDNATITTVNFVYMVLANYLQMTHIPPIAHRIIGEFLSTEESPVMKRTVNELLFGYKDPLLVKLNKALPSLVKNDTVSIFYASVADIGSNTFLINTGTGYDEKHEERINKLGVVELFNLQPNLTYWSDKYANMINGTDSTIWHPTVSKTERVESFIPDICRSVYLEFDETHRNPFNIDVYRFSLPDSVFANSTENRGFCVNISRSNKSIEDQCLPSGLFSLTTCVHLPDSGEDIPLPIIASNPHFLSADLSVRNAIEGLDPESALHRSFADIEPITGVVMNGSRRLQININVINDSAIRPIANLKPLVYPMIWINEHSEIDQENAKIFRNKVLTPIQVVHVLKYVLLGVGIVALIATVTLFLYHRSKNSQSGTPFPSSHDEVSPLLI